MAGESATCSEYHILGSPCGYPGIYVMMGHSPKWCDERRLDEHKCFATLQLEHNVVEITV